MKIIKVILFFLLLILLVLFIVQNIGQPVEIQFFSSENVVSTEMIVVVTIAFILGTILGMLFSGIQLLKTKNKLRVVTKEYEKQKKELNLLRNKELKEIENE
ncbi:MAG: LapA family protein [Candidatus Marinimicrobia bacterium]|nr:LapA family protein [Candidatus Neomarinimicrobiota bacterium]